MLTRPQLFSSFRTRLVVLIVALVTLTQVAAFLLVNAANVRNATLQIERNLELASGVFRRIIDERSAGLIGDARLLSGDFAFKQAFATGDRGTLVSAMDNHLQRIDADIMVLLDPAGQLLASTAEPERHGGANPWPALLERAEENEFGESSGIVAVGRSVLQMTVVPLFTPELSAWILCGFRIDNALAHDLGKISEVSVLRRVDQHWQAVASTLPAGVRAALLSALDGQSLGFERSRRIDLEGETFVTLLTPLADDADISVVAVLQRSLSNELLPYENLQRYMIVLFAAGLAISLAAAIMIARGVTGPVLTLAAGVRQIAAGDYAGRMDLSQRDEIGQLAEAFNSMASGLQDRERVRNLLGKVVSPEIAEELLNRRIELGGEEREVSVLFADVRNFTALCEGSAAGAILDLLNRYLTRVSHVIEANGGVVDKYIGDAVMALFGAPLAHTDDAVRAVHAALQMRDAVAAFNEELRAEGKPPLGIGIGVNTARVVAGNMGSDTRLNYTVIGDGVNLASRVEGLTRRYGVTVIVSASTRDAASGFVYRELDRVRVKGKLDAVTVYEPLGIAGALNALQISTLDRHAHCLEKYYLRDWAGAAADFSALATEFPGDALAGIYAARCQRFDADPPGTDWDGVYEYREK